MRIITDLMGEQAAPELIGIHSNMPGAVPPDIDKALQAWARRPPSGLSAEETHAYDRLCFYTKGVAYALEMGTARRRSTESPIHP